jgi:hypothetical protein
MLSGIFQNGNNHFFIQLTAFKYVFQVFGDGRNFYIKKIRHFRLAEPNGFTPEDRVYPDRAVRCLVKDDLGFVGL